MLASLAITPEMETIPAGLRRQFAVTGTYSDGSKEDLTDVVAWSSSDLSVAQVSAGVMGLVFAIGEGSAEISVTRSGKSARAQLTVGPPQVASVKVRMHPALGWARNDGTWIALRQVRPFVAFEVYTNGDEVDVTEQATWSSSDPAIAAVGDDLDWKGVVAGLSPGSATIRASLGSMLGMVTVEVLPALTLDGWIDTSMAPMLAGAAMDREGNALAVWYYEWTGGLWGTSPILASASYSPGQGWSVPTRLDLSAIDDIPGGTVAMNASGHALLAWSGARGVYVSAYTPGDGWSPARAILVGSSPFAQLGEGVSVAIDDAGDGLAVWVDANTRCMTTSRYLHEGDTWSTPQPVPGVFLGNSAAAFQLVMNPAGAAALAWQSWTDSWTAHASRFVPGTGEGAGWQAPELLCESPSNMEPAAAINGPGEIVVTCVQDVGEAGWSLHGRRFTPAGGWGPNELIAPDEAKGALSPVVALNDAGEAVVVWCRLSDYGIWASRSAATGAWLPGEQLWHRVPSGTPTVLPPHMTSDGRILAAYQPEEMNPPIVAVSRYAPGSGWSEPEGLPYVQHYGKLDGIRIASNPSGNTVVLWGENKEVWTVDGLNTIEDIYADAGLRF